MSEPIKIDHIESLLRIAAGNTVDKSLRAQALAVVNWMRETDTLNFRLTTEHMPQRNVSVYAQSLDGSHHILKCDVNGTWRDVATNNQFMPPVMRWAYHPKTQLQQSIRKAQKQYG